MKKRFTILLALGLGLTLSAQQKMPYSALKQITKKVKPNKALTGLEGTPNNFVEREVVKIDKPTVESEPMYNRSGELCDEQIGYSHYDLQTNQAVQDRLIMHEGALLAAWTFSAETPPASADRGTGYQRRDVDDWLGEPDVRIEADRRTGWPSILTTSGGKEVVVNHPNAGFNVYTRDIGVGDWVESMIPTNTLSGMLWPRACSGGADGNSVHVIGITTPVGNGGAPENGQDGSLLYYRSTDQGANWDVIDFLHPGHDSTQIAAFGGDSYAIDAQGNTVAYAYFSGIEGDTFVMVSEDNGDTFTKRTVIDLPLELYEFDTEITDINDDGIPDTLRTSDGSGAVHVDTDGVVHVSYGVFRFYDDLVGDGFYTTFPGLSEIYYWNSNMADNSPQLIHTLPDDFIGIAEYPDYRANITGMVNLASDPTDPSKLALVFAGMVSDLFFDDTYNFRHIYAMKSITGGQYWGPAEDVTPYDEEEDTDELECVYPDVNGDIIDNHIQIVYHRDDAPGVTLRIDNDITPDDDDGDNFVRFLDVDLDYLLVGIEEQEVIKNSIAIYPNPSVDGVFQMEKLNNLEYTQYQVIDMLGKVVFNSEFNNRNSAIEVIDLSHLRKGVYLLKAETTTNFYSQTLIIE